MRPGMDADRSSLNELLRWHSELAGSDTNAIDHYEHGVTVGRDPEYGPNDVIAALVDEVRRRRAPINGGLR